MPIGTFDSRYCAFRYSTARYEKHQFLICAEDLEDVGTLLVLTLQYNYQDCMMFHLYCQSTILV